MYWVTIRPDGMIESYGQAVQPDDVSVAPTHRLVWGPPDEVLQAPHYFDNAENTFRAVPPCPGAHYVFDSTLQAWGPDTGAARREKVAQVEQERLWRNLAPILFDGKRLDGDGVAQKNLADKLAGVKERIRLNVGMAPELMVWKDADNLVHTWSDLQAYCDWLAGYVIALEDRGTRLYAAAWQHKATLDALTDIDAILAYDITTGWPA